MINGTNGCGGPLRVLVVDDHAAVRAGVQTMMAREPGLQPVGGARTRSEPQSRRGIAARPTGVRIAGLNRLLRRRETLAIIFPVQGDVFL